MISFLEQETNFDNKNKRVNVTRLFLWFLGDFGGIKGVKKIIEEKLNIDISGFGIKFKSYHWDEKLLNFHPQLQIA
ncbi:hypothetical protein HHH56_01210 [Flammeovirga yaeyamensis]|nr:hypothetical protein [Flammeovirga yaeyamensis]